MPPTSRHRLSALAAVLAVASSASADPRDPVAAESLFREARDAAKRGDFAAACPKLAESQRLDPASGTLFNLADCEERIGKLASAWQHYQEVSEQLPAGDDRVGVAKEHVAALKPRLPRLTVRLSGAPAGTKVTRDGVELGAASLGSPLPVDPGAHVVLATTPSGKQQKTDVTLKEGASETVTLTISESDASAAPKAGATTTPPAPTSGGGSSATAGYVIGGVGAAGLVVSLITGALVLGKKSTVTSGCDANKYCSPDAVDAGSSGKSLGTISTISFAVGVAGLGIGTYLILTSKPDGTQTALAGGPDSNGGSVRLVGSFL